MIISERPPLEEVPAFYRGYVEEAPDGNIIRTLRSASDRLWDTVARLPAGHADHRYAPEKWSVMEVFQHVVDAERVFSYRALRFARNDGTELPGFDENSYAMNAVVAHREFHEILREHDALRWATIELFRSFTPEMLGRTGIANGQRISVRALGWVIAGHAVHHMTIINERYLGHGKA